MLVRLWYGGPKVNPKRVWILDYGGQRKNASKVDFEVPTETAYDENRFDDPSMPNGVVQCEAKTVEIDPNTGKAIVR